jgi:hypothetical protein
MLELFPNRLNDFKLLSRENNSFLNYIEENKNAAR